MAVHHPTYYPGRTQPKTEKPEWEDMTALEKDQDVLKAREWDEFKEGIPFEGE